MQLNKCNCGYCESITSDHGISFIVYCMQRRFSDIKRYRRRNFWNIPVAARFNDRIICRCESGYNNNLYGNRYNSEWMFKQCISCCYGKSEPNDCSHRTIIINLQRLIHYASGNRCFNIHLVTFGYTFFINRLVSYRDTNSHHNIYRDRYNGRWMYRSDNTDSGRDTYANRRRIGNT